MYNTLNTLLCIDVKVFNSFYESNSLQRLEHIYNDYLYKKVNGRNLNDNFISLSGMLVNIRAYKHYTVVC